MRLSKQLESHETRKTLIDPKERKKAKNEEKFGLNAEDKRRIKQYSCSKSCTDIQMATTVM